MAGKHWRFKINKKIGYQGWEIRYGQGCECSWLIMQLRIPDEIERDDYIRELLSKL